MSRTGLSLIALLLTLLTLASCGSAPPGFVDLFPLDGVPEGWMVRSWSDLEASPQEESSWRVDNGVLQGGEARGTWLVSEAQYADFELEFEFKLGAYGNSGCALRAPLRGDPSFNGLELQLVDPRYKPDAPDSERTGGLYRAVPPADQPFRPDDWNHCRVRLVGSEIRVEINGRKTLDLDLVHQRKVVRKYDGTEARPVALRPRKGHIAFQELSRGGDSVQIRYARIKSLDEPS